MSEELSELFVIIIKAVIAVIAVVLLIYIFFLLTLQKALSRCRPQNRTMEPGMVWLNLIPLFNIVWHFITVIRVSSSLTNEFRARGRHSKGEDYAQTIGITSLALNLAGIIPLLGIVCGLIIPLLGIVCGLAALICWIIYWSKVAGFSARLAATPATDYYDEDDEDDYDAPRGRGRRDRDDGDDRLGGGKSA
ncbi:MAG: hypothetical protein FJ304_27735 [Planctomycetes bacterium]|nr:hypothetical protein [Planctomycetota bacterium]